MRNPIVMPELLINYGTVQQVVILRKRITIGSGPENRIIVRDRGVLPRHATVECADDAVTLRPSPEAKPLLVNGWQYVSSAHLLWPGDWFELGRLRVEVQSNGPLKVDRSPPQGDDSQTFVESTADLLQVALPPSQPEEVQRSSTSTGTCGACQCSLNGEVDVTICPSCGLGYHADCWRENQGCGTYGCTYDGVLRPPPDRIEVPAEAAPTSQVVLDASPFPWEHLVLTGNVLAWLFFAAFDVSLNQFICWAIPGCTWAALSNQKRVLASLARQPGEANHVYYLRRRVKTLWLAFIVSFFAGIAAR